jgi:hypothetical protein
MFSKTRLGHYRVGNAHFYLMLLFVNASLSLQTTSAASVVFHSVKSTNPLFSPKIGRKEKHLRLKNLGSTPVLSEDRWQPSVIEENGKRRTKEQKRSWRYRRCGGYFSCCSPGCFWCSSLVAALLLAGLAALLIATLSKTPPTPTKTSMSVSLYLSNLILLLSVNSNKYSDIDYKHLKHWLVNLFS